MPPTKRGPCFGERLFSRADGLEDFARGSGICEGKLGCSVGIWVAQCFFGAGAVEVEGHRSDSANCRRSEIWAMVSRGESNSRQEISLKQIGRVSRGESNSRQEISLK